MKKNNTVLAGGLLLGGIIAYLYYNKKDYSDVKEKLYEGQKEEIFKYVNEQYPLNSNQQPTQTGGDAMTPPTVIETGQPSYTTKPPETMGVFHGKKLPLYYNL